MAQRNSRFGLNRKRGRDLVLGDIHGCFDTVEHALAALKHDPARDRLFSAGDLIDHGPRSDDALAWIRSHFTGVARGNHEQAMIDWLLAGGRARMHSYAAQWNTSQEARWWLARARTGEERNAWLETLCALPFALTIETATGTVGVMHGQGPSRERTVWDEIYGRPGPPRHDIEWDAFCDRLDESGHRGSETLTLEALDVLWNRSTVRETKPSAPALPAGFTGTGAVLIGHNAAREPGWTARGVLCIDTGVHIAGLGHLTIAEVQSGDIRLHRFANRRKSANRRG